MKSRSRYFSCAYNKVNGCLCYGKHCQNCKRFGGWREDYICDCKCSHADCETCKDWVSDKAMKLKRAGKSCKLCDSCKRECKSKNRTYCNLFEIAVKDIVCDLKQRLNNVRYADAYRRKYYRKKSTGNCNCSADRKKNKICNNGIIPH